MDPRCAISAPRPGVYLRVNTSNNETTEETEDLQTEEDILGTETQKNSDDDWITDEDISSLENTLARDEEEDSRRKSKRKRRLPARYNDYV